MPVKSTIFIHASPIAENSGNKENSKHSHDRPVMLCSQQDLKPEKMFPRLNLYFEAAHDYLRMKGQQDQWSPELASGLLVLLSSDALRHAEFVHLVPSDPDNVSIDESRNKGLPEFLPCSRVEDNVDFVYDVFLTPSPDSYRIKWREIRK